MGPLIGAQQQDEVSIAAVLVPHKCAATPQGIMFHRNAICNSPVEPTHAKMTSVTLEELQREYPTLRQQAEAVRSYL